LKERHPFLKAGIKEGRTFHCFDFFLTLSGYTLDALFRTMDFIDGDTVGFRKKIKGSSLIIP
jgi:hypothetical protein